MNGKDTIDSMLIIHTIDLSISNLYISEKIQEKPMLYIVGRNFFLFPTT